MENSYYKLLDSWRRIKTIINWYEECIKLLQMMCNNMHLNISQKLFHLLNILVHFLCYDILAHTFDLFKHLLVVATNWFRYMIVALSGHLHEKWRHFDFWKRFLRLKVRIRVRVRVNRISVDVRVRVNGNAFKYTFKTHNSDM